MYRVIERSGRTVAIGDDSALLIFSVSCFERARGRQQRTAVIRNPIVVTVDGQVFIFTKREWETARKVAWEASCRGLRRFLREETEEIEKNSKSLSKVREARIQRQANAIGELIKNKGY